MVDIETLRADHDSDMAEWAEFYRELELAISDSTMLKILKYIKDNQDKELTKEDVTKYMDHEGILSRPVTLRLIKKLLDPDIQIILNMPKKPNSQSRLIINPEFDFKEMEVNLLISLIKDVQKQFEPLDIETKGANSILIRELLTTIERFGKQEEIYTPKQMEKFKKDYQKKRVKQLEKLSA